MKSVLLATTLALASLSVYAEPLIQPSITIEAEHLDVHNRDAVNSVYIIPAVKVGAYTFDLKGQVADTENTRVLSSLVESRIRYDYDLGNGFTAYGRLGLGEQLATTGNYGFYTIEPGVSYAVNSKVTVSLSDRYTDAFQSAKHVQQNEVYVSGAYKLTKVDSVALTVNRSYVDIEATGVNLSYTRSF